MGSHTSGTAPPTALPFLSHGMGECSGGWRANCWRVAWAQGSLGLVCVCLALPCLAFWRLPLPGFMGASSKALCHEPLWWAHGCSRHVEVRSLTLCKVCWMLWRAGPCCFPQSCSQLYYVTKAHTYTRLFIVDTACLVAVLIVVSF